MEQFVEKEKWSRLRDGMIDYFEHRKNAPVQAFINNMSLPDTIDDLCGFLESNDKLLDPEFLMVNSTVNWSVPRWCKKGDIVLFMVTVTSAAAISRVRAELKRSERWLTPDKCRLVKFGIMREESVYDKVGGCIFAIGRVSGEIEVVPGERRVYADVNDVVYLDEPVQYDQFKAQVPVAKGGSITPVYSDKYSYLKHELGKNNDLPMYILKSRSEPIREHLINKDNWLEVAKYYRFHYTLEEQFRKAFVDYLLKEISDNRKLYAECYCKKADGQYGYIDNVILFKGKYLPVEVKLNVDLEANLIGQVSKYCALSVLNLTDKQTVQSPLDEAYSDKVIIIDTYGIYLYDDVIGDYQKIYNFFNLATKADLQEIRDLIADVLLGQKPKQRKTVNLFDANIQMLDSEIVGISRNEEAMTNYEEELLNQKKYRQEYYEKEHISNNNFERVLTSEMEPEEALRYINMLDEEILYKSI